MNSEIKNDSNEKRRARLRWRARRGLLENDLILTRFFDKNELDLTDSDVSALTKLFEMTDNELLDILLSRKELEGEYKTKPIQAIVRKIQNS